MNKIFNSINMHNIDSNTKKQIEEPGWRVAAGEEEKIFLEYYLSGKKVNRINTAIRNILVVALFISVGTAGFELAFKTDASYDPVPSVIGIITALLLWLINEVVRKIIQRNIKNKVQGNIYVIDAMAHPAGDNRVVVSLNDDTYNTERFVYNESVNPMDYVHDEGGRNIGFRVLLFMVIYDDKIQSKVVIGSDGYRSLLDKCKK